MRSTAAAVVAVACLALAVTAATTVLEIQDDAGVVTIGNLLDTNLTRKSAGVLGATNLQVDNTLLVAGPTTLGAATVTQNLAVQGTATVTGTTTLTGAATLTAGATVNGATTFNAQTTFNTVVPQVNTDMYVTGLIRHSNSAYHRTRLMGMTAKIYAGNSQAFQPCGTPATITCTQSMMVVGFTNSVSVNGVGAFNDGWSFSAHQMWRGGDVTSPTGGFSAQNGFNVPTDPVTGNQLPGYYRFQGSINLGGCTENAGASTGTTTWRSLYITQGYNSATSPGFVRYFGGTTVREAYPKEVSLSVSDTIFMNNNAWAWLSFANNCVASNTISTIQPLGPPSVVNGNPSAMAGPYAMFSITYVGE